MPACIREALNAESGLSDGLVVLPHALSQPDQSRRGRTRHSLSSHCRAADPIWHTDRCWDRVPGRLAVGSGQRRNWASAPFQQIAMIALAPLCWILATSVGTSPFIAAFSAGIAVQVGFRARRKDSSSSVRTRGAFYTCCLFSLWYVGRGGVGRIAPCAGAVCHAQSDAGPDAARGHLNDRTRLSGPSVLFLGWFGPRGIGSIVLGLVAAQEVQTAGTELVRMGIIVTVFLSILAHGFSASPGIKLYARQIARLDAGAPEYEAVSGMPTA